MSVLSPKVPEEKGELLLPGPKPRAAIPRCRVPIVAWLVVPVSGARCVIWLHHELQADFTSASKELPLPNVGSRPLLTFSLLFQNFYICFSRPLPPQPPTSSLGQTSLPVLFMLPSMGNWKVTWLVTS